ncbi:universal stress protein [bacterium]|nr:universal stress protein [candidate division CSSED10-310 bacterium]
MNHTRINGIHSILCPTDFSESAQYALATAIMLARRFHASIDLIHVIEPSAYESDRIAAGEKTYHDVIRERLDDLVASMKYEGALSSTVVSGIPYMEITRRAAETGADIIVIGTHGRTGIRHLLIGSVAEKVVRTATCPVLTVRHPDLHVTTD